MKKVLLAALLLLPLAASAQELTYKNLKRAGATRFTDCNMFGDQTSVRVYQRNVLKFKVSGPKKYYKLPRKYALGACGQLPAVSPSPSPTAPPAALAVPDTAYDSFFAKTGAEAEAAQFDVTKDDLVSVGKVVKKQCKTLKPFSVGGSGLIYKAFGTKGGVSFIFREHISGVPFPSCVEIIDTLGNHVTNMGLYAMGGEYAARYYANVGCGLGENLDGDGVAAAAEAKTDSEDIIFDLGEVCIGPVEGDVCINSKAC